MPSKTDIDQKTKQDKKLQKRNYIFAVGRRREAVARVRLYEPSGGKMQISNVDYHKGDVIVNDLPYGTYFGYFAYIPYFKDFFDLTKALDKYFFSIRVAGGGKRGQVDAILQGMARALDIADSEKYRDLLKEKGYFSRDPRTRERRKVGMGGKARRKKQSPKR